MLPDFNQESSRPWRTRPESSEFSQRKPRHQSEFGRSGSFAFVADKSLLSVPTVSSFGL